MPPNDFQGINGLNTRTLNVSRDQIMAAATVLKGRYLLTQDDPELVAAARKAGRADDSECDEGEMCASHDHSNAKRLVNGFSTDCAPAATGALTLPPW